jgi:p-hydroxybenzoate 3-monooxygenase
MMLHRFPEHGPYERRMQETELAALAASPTAQALLAENYTGLPFS